MTSAPVLSIYFSVPFYLFAGNHILLYYLYLLQSLCLLLDTSVPNFRDLMTVFRMLENIIAFPETNAESTYYVSPW